MFFPKIWSGSSWVVCTKKSEPLLQLGIFSQESILEILVQLLSWEKELMTREITGHLSCHILCSHLCHIFCIFNSLPPSLPCSGHVTETGSSLPPMPKPSLLYKPYGLLLALIPFAVSAAFNINNHTILLKILALLVFSDLTLQSFWLIPLNHIHLPLKCKYLLRFKRYLPDILPFKGKFHTKLKEDSRSWHIIPVPVRMAEN